MDISLKKCPCCGQIKSKLEFPKRKADKHGRYKDGLDYWCKECTKTSRLKWYSKFGLQYYKNWTELHRDRTNKTSLERYHKNKDVIRDKLNKRYKIDNDFRLMHIKAKNNWVKNNPEKVKLQKKRYYEEAKLDSFYRLKMNIRNSINKSLKRNKNGYHWENLVGYTLEDLKKHLAKQFVNEMSWENYGQWHIDHIIPVSVFNFKKPNDIDFRKCWDLKNLRPLWKEENLKKRNLLEIPFQPSLAI